MEDDGKSICSAKKLFRWGCDQVQIKMLTSGPNKNYTPGQIIEVDPVRATALMAGRHAGDPSVPEIETKQQIDRGCAGWPIMSSSPASERSLQGLMQ